MSIAKAVVASLLLSAAAATNAAPGAPQFIFGVGTHMMGDKPENYKYIKELGVNSVRDDLTWEKIETRKSNYWFPLNWDNYINWQLKNDIQPYLIIDYGNRLYENRRTIRTSEAAQAYAEYAARAVEHYSRVKFFELWNEWDGDPSDYVKLLKETYPVVKRKRGDTIILAGSAGTRRLRAGWFKDFVQAGGLKYADAVSIHPYAYCQNDHNAEAFLNLLESMAALTGDKDIYITEVGWPTGQIKKDCSISENVAAEYMAASYLISRCQINTKGFWWYVLRDGAKSAGNGFGLYTGSWQEKKAANVARRISSLNNDLECVNPAKSGLSTARMNYRIQGRKISFDEAKKMLLK